MTPAEITALLGETGTLAAALGGGLGHLLSARAQERTARAAERAAVVTAAATAKASEDTAQDRLIDQLQEELKRYRDDNDRRVERLEGRVENLTTENRGYRAFIGVQRDHMTEHGVPLPPWPDGLPR